jgi:hypothetical protein
VLVGARHTPRSPRPLGWTSPNHLTWQVQQASNAGATSTTSVSSHAGGCLLSRASAQTLRSEVKVERSFTLVNEAAADAVPRIHGPNRHMGRGSVGTNNRNAYT